MTVFVMNSYKIKLEKTINKISKEKLKKSLQNWDSHLSKLFSSVGYYYERFENNYLSFGGADEVFMFHRKLTRIEEVYQEISVNISVVDCLDYNKPNTDIILHDIFGVNIKDFMDSDLLNNKLWLFQEYCKFMTSESNIKI